MHLFPQFYVTFVSLTYPLSPVARSLPVVTQVRALLRQLARRVADSDRTRLTAGAIADALYGLQVGTYWHYLAPV